MVAHLRALGELHEDPVGVGVFLKRQRKFAELRPRQRWVSMSVRRGRDWETFRLAGPADVDDAVVACLTRAFSEAG